MTADNFDKLMSIFMGKVVELEVRDLAEKKRVEFGDQRTAFRSPIPEQMDANSRYDIYGLIEGKDRKNQVRHFFGVHYLRDLPGIIEQHPQYTKYFIVPALKSLEPLN